MRKYMLCSSLLVLVLSFTGCSNEAPNDLSPINAVTIANYNPDDDLPSVSNSTTDKVVTDLSSNETATTTCPDSLSETSLTTVSTTKLSKKDETIPKNYKKISGDVYAIMKDGEIVGYMKGTYDSVKEKWKWEECDISGEVKTTTTKKTTVKTTTTTAKKTSKKKTTTAAKKTTKKKTTPKKTTVKTTTTTTVPYTQLPQTQPPQTQPPQTQPPKTTTKKKTTKKTTTTTRKVVTQPKKTTAKPQKNFEWSKISQSQCPLDVSNYFDSFIVMNNSVCQQTKSGGCTYVLIKAKKGNSVKIINVTNSGQVKYRLSSGGDNYVIIKFNQEKTATYLQQ